ncbi:MAG: hypothetical protein V4494_05085 [Chlamydiota bacterium]
MDFIGRILGKFLAFLTFTGCYSAQSYGDIDHSTYGKYVEEVISGFAKEMQKHGYRCILDGGGMPYDVRELDIGFMVYQKGSIELGREKIVFLTKNFLEAINSHERIRPYLREYPFPESRVHVTLSFCKPDNFAYADGSITDTHCTGSRIIYKVSDPNYKKAAIKILEEPYSEALAHVNKMVQVNHEVETKQSMSNLHEGASVVPSRKRLGTFVTDLNGFTPGRELEILGIQSIEERKDPADDIGELIGGICDAHFGEDFLERLAQAVSLKPTGEYMEYWENGQMKAKIPYKDGRLEGHVHAWYQNGNSAFKGYYKEGRRIGIQLALFPRGIKGGLDAVARVLEYDMEGRLHNRQKTTSSEPKLLSSIYYKHGALHGSASIYTGRGRCNNLGEWKYKEGKLIKDKYIPKEKF